MASTYLTSAILAVSVLTGGCKSAEPTASQTPNLVTLAEGIPEVSKFVSLAKRAGLAEMLEGSGRFTVLAPDNQAFEALGSDLLDRLKSAEGSNELRGLIERHIVAGAIPANLLGDRLGAANALLTRESEAGYVHVIDKVITGD